MIAVKIVGGLGNQMYCYALYRTLLARGRSVKMDISFYDHQNSPIIDKRKYLLSEVFNVEEKLMSRAEYFVMRAERKLGLLNTYADKETCFQPEILNVKRGIISGYWQSFKYFAEIEDTPIGATVLIETSYGPYTYRVDEKKTADGTDRWYMDAGQNADLVLYTCYPRDNGGKRRTERCVLLCTLIDGTEVAQ